jgi:hypothetical protein
MRASKEKASAYQQSTPFGFDTGCLERSPLGVSCRFETFVVKRG